jgi:hypothetical protein
MQINVGESSRLYTLWLLYFQFTTPIWMVKFDGYNQTMIDKQLQDKNQTYQPIYHQFQVPLELSFFAITFVCNEIYWHDLAHVHNF